MWLLSSAIGVRVELGSTITPDLSHTRPADVLVLNMESGKLAALDITVTSPLIPSILTAASLSEGAAANRRRLQRPGSIEQMTPSVQS